MLTIFYIACVFIDWILIVSGTAAIENEDLICYKGTFVLLNSNLGSLYMLVYTFVVYFYAAFMWYVFYEVPKRYGVVTRRNVDDVDMVGLDSTYLIENEENLKTVVRELDHDRRFTKDQKRLLDSRRASDDAFNPLIVVDN